MLGFGNSSSFALHRNIYKVINACLIKTITSSKIAEGIGNKKSKLAYLSKIVMLLVVLVLVLSSCKSMKESVIINAQPQVVWSVLTDLEKYPEWNPFFVEAKGPLRRGEKRILV